MPDMSTTVRKFESSPDSTLVVAFVCSEGERDEHWEVEESENA